MSYIWKTTGCIQQHCHGNLKENVKLDDGRNRKDIVSDHLILNICVWHLFWNVSIFFLSCSVVFQFSLSEKQKIFALFLINLIKKEKYGDP
jgi:hypothetical protein